MKNRKFAKYLHDWGRPILDATNKVYDEKHQLFEKFRGPKWILGAAVATVGLFAPAAAPLLAGAGVVIVLVDPTLDSLLTSQS